MEDVIALGKKASRDVGFANGQTRCVNWLVTVQTGWQWKLTIGGANLRGILRLSVRLTQKVDAITPTKLGTRKP